MGFAIAQFQCGLYGIQAAENCLNLRIGGVTEAHGGRLKDWWPGRIRGFTLFGCWGDGGSVDRPFLWAYSGRLTKVLPSSESLKSRIALID